MAGLEGTPGGQAGGGRSCAQNGRGNVPGSGRRVPVCRGRLTVGETEARRARPCYQEDSHPARTAPISDFFSRLVYMKAHCTGE